MQYYDETPEIVKFYNDAEFERRALPGSLIQFEPPASGHTLPQWPLESSLDAQRDETNPKVSAPPLHRNTEPAPAQSSPQSFTSPRPVQQTAPSPPQGSPQSFTFQQRTIPFHDGNTLLAFQADLLTAI